MVLNMHCKRDHDIAWYSYLTGMSCCFFMCSPEIAPILKKYVTVLFLSTCAVCKTNACEKCICQISCTSATCISVPWFRWNSFNGFKTIGSGNMSPALSQQIFSFSVSCHWGEMNQHEETNKPVDVLDVVEVESCLGEHDTLDGLEQNEIKYSTWNWWIASNSNHPKLHWLPSMSLVQFINLVTKFHETLALLKFRCSKSSSLRHGKPFCSSWPRNHMPSAWRVCETTAGWPGGTGIVSAVGAVGDSDLANHLEKFHVSVLRCGVVHGTTVAVWWHDKGARPSCSELLAKSKRSRWAQASKAAGLENCWDDLAIAPVPIGVHQKLEIETTEDQLTNIIIYTITVSIHVDSSYCPYIWHD